MIIGGGDGEGEKLDSLFSTFATATQVMVWENTGKMVPCSMHRKVISNEGIIMQLCIASECSIKSERVRSRKREKERSSGAGSV